MIIDIPEDELERFVNECSFIGPNAESVRDTMIAALNRDRMTIDAAEKRLVGTIREIQRAGMQVHPDSSYGTDSAVITIVGVNLDQRTVNPKACRDGIDRG